MSQGFHQGIFSFSDGFGRSPETVDSQALAAQQRRREGLRVQGFDQGEAHISESASTPATMLSDMFDFPSAGGNCAADLLVNQIPINYRLQRPPAAAFSGNWYNPKPQGGDPQQNELAELNADSAAAMHLFLMNPSQSQQRAPSPHHLHSFQSPSFVNESFRGGGVEGQGLSLSLSSSLQQLEMAQQVGYVGSIGMGNMMRHPKYAKATQELLMEFCSTGMGLMKKGRKERRFGSFSTEPNPSSSNAVGGSTAGTTALKEALPLSPAERFEHQRRKAKLISILYEVDRRYSHYTEKMQATVSSFDSVMGFGAAAPYTGLARRAMSRHFRCLKDAIAAQLKHAGLLLGEKEGSGPSAITKGETPRLRLVDQILRQQRAFHQFGAVEQESWRPQRGLPERSVNVLRAWLFEHFLHPYPSDADKHLLARQTGLSRSQVSNWFINARVRLWKPMVEEMYQREANEAAETGDRERATSESTTQPQPRRQRPEDMAGGTDLPHPPLASLNRGGGGGDGDGDVSAAVVGTEAIMSAGEDGVRIGILEDYGAAMAAALERTGTSGDVSLTLGLRHAGSTPASGGFSLADFGGC